MNHYGWPTFEYTRWDTVSGAQAGRNARRLQLNAAHDVTNAVAAAAVHFSQGGGIAGNARVCIRPRDSAPVRLHPVLLMHDVTAVNIMAAADFEPALAPTTVDGGDLGVQEMESPAEPAVEPPMVARGLYLVRVPKPPVDESLVKRLQADFQAHITKLKAMNAKCQAQRVRTN